MKTVERFVGFLLIRSRPPSDRRLIPIRANAVAVRKARRPRPLNETYETNVRRSWTDQQRVLLVDLTRSPNHSATTAPCAHRTAGVDVYRSLEIVTVHCRRSAVVGSPTTSDLRPITPFNAAKVASETGHSFRSLWLADGAPSIRQVRALCPLFVEGRLGRRWSCCPSRIC